MKKLLEIAQKPPRQLTKIEIDQITGASGQHTISPGDATWDWEDTHGTGGAPRQDYNPVD